MMKEKLAADFLKDAQVNVVMDALEAKGAVARFVGGTVRDALLGERPREIDIAIDASPQEVMEFLRAGGIKPLPTGLAHGTVSASAGGLYFEITSLRVDKTTDGRHAEVAFTKDWQGDAARRDFTINALYAGRDGTIYDPHDGRADLAQGLVRFIGDPRERIAEDYLRILRFFRFFASHGRGAIDSAGLAASAEAAARLADLSPERIARELLRLLAAPRAGDALDAMAESGILAVMLPEAKNRTRCRRLHEIWQEAFFPPDSLLALGALLTGGETALTAAKRLKLSNAQKDRLSQMEPNLAGAARMVAYLSAREVRRLLYRLGRDAFSDRLMLAWSSDSRPQNAVQWRALLAMAESWERPVFPLTGRMMREAGVPEGPEMGRVAREVEDWWIDADFTQDVFSVIERLKAVVLATIY